MFPLANNLSPLGVVAAVAVGGGTPYGSPVIYYSMESGTISGANLADGSGNSHTGTLVGSPTTGTGHIGDALVLNGSSQEVDVPQVLASMPLSFAFWFNNTLSGEQDMFSLQGSTGAPWIRAGSVNSNRIFCQVFDGSNAPIADNTGLSMSAGWHHLAVVVTTSTITVYLDGSNIGSVSNTATGYTAGSLTVLTRGTLGNLHGYGLWTNGSIDEFYLFNYELTTTDVSNIYALT